MAKIATVQNGFGRPARKATAKRNGITKTQAMSYLKKNGLKAISTKTNPRRKRKGRGRKRNGLMTVPRARNGIFGNTKSDVKQVLSLGGGALLTKTIGRMVSPFVAPQLAKVGAGQFSEAAVDGVLAFTLIPILAGKVAGAEGAKFARLGALLVLGLDIVEMVAPQALSFNPFNTAPIVLANGQPALVPAAVAQIVNETDASPSDKAKVAGAMAALSAGVPIDSQGGMAWQLPVNE